MIYGIGFIGVLVLVVIGLAPDFSSAHLLNEWTYPWSKGMEYFSLRVCALIHSLVTQIHAVVHILIKVHFENSTF